MEIGSILSILSGVSACHILSPAHPTTWALRVGTWRQARPIHLNVSIVRDRVRDGLKSDIVVADFRGQTADDFLYLLHSLGNPLASQVHLGGKGAAKTVISNAGPEALGMRK